MTVSTQTVTISNKNIDIDAYLAIPIEWEFIQQLS